MGISSKKNSAATQGYEFVNEFYPKNIKRTIHLITQQLKQESSLNVDYLFLPFRKEQSNEALLRFLNTIMPKGDGKPMENESKLIKIIKKTAPGVLFQSLKYIWSRTILPATTKITSGNPKKWNGIVGFEAYLKFKEMEAEKEFPKKAFLEIMPRCLSSPDHASLVYDMFDLITTVSSNAPKNKMSCRKISKMCAIWAFDCTNEDVTFVSGIEAWVPKAEAMFHLSLAFIRSFAPDTENIDSDDFPVSLLHVLKDNSYPPTEPVTKNMLQVPVITLHRHYKEEPFQSNLKPWSLIKNINDLFKLDDFMILEKDSNQIDPLNKNKKLKLSRQQKALIKSIFSDKSTIETISKKMSKQSKKLMKEFTTRHSSFQAGWVINSDGFAVDNGDYDFLSWTTCFIDDFYIWTWMSSLSNEEAPNQRTIFGRSLIIEFEFDAFKKWVVFEENGKVFQNRAPQHKNVTERLSSSSSPISSAKAVKKETISPVISKQEFISKHVKEEPVIIKTMIGESSIITNDESIANDTNVSSVYNNKTIINGYMTNGDISHDVSHDYSRDPISESRYELPPVNVDESAFKIDLPDIDPSQITINGQTQGKFNTFGGDESKDSISDAIKGLDDELKQVEKKMGKFETPLSTSSAGLYVPSGGAEAKSSQINSTPQRPQNGKFTSREDIPHVSELPSLQNNFSNEFVPERSPERRRNNLSERAVNAQQAVHKQPPPPVPQPMIQKQQPAPNMNLRQQPVSNMVQQQHAAPKMVQQQSAPNVIQQQHAAPNMIQKQQNIAPNMIQQRNQRFSPSPVVQQQHRNLTPPNIHQKTSSTLYEQPRLNNNSSSQITNGSAQTSEGSTPITNGSSSLGHNKTHSVNGAMPQQKLPQLQPQSQANPIQVPPQVLHQAPKLPRAFTMQNLAIQQQPAPGFHNKQSSLGVVNPNHMQRLDNNQPQNMVPGSDQYAQKHMQKENRQQFQQPMMQRNGGMPRSQSYNQMSQMQKFTPFQNQPRKFAQQEQPFLPQPRGTMTMVSQQNPYMRQQTMASPYNQGSQQQQQQATYLAPQLQVGGNRFNGNQGMIMPTSHKGKRQEKMNLQQQLRNGAFGM